MLPTTTCAAASSQILTFATFADVLIGNANMRLVSFRMDAEETCGKMYLQNDLVGVVSPTARNQDEMHRTPLWKWQFMSAQPRLISHSGNSIDRCLATL